MVKCTYLYNRMAATTDINLRLQIARQVKTFSQNVVFIDFSGVFKLPQIKAWMPIFYIWSFSLVFSSIDNLILFDSLF